MTNIVNDSVNTIRFLSADTVQQANSGHPGFPMGAAAIAYTIWARHLRINPQDPQWFDRDRFVLSGGHGSAMLYSLLTLYGYLTLDDLKHFRSWGSLTPGHPEYRLTSGVEATTGPLGQGFANGVGMAIAEAHLAAVYNRPNYKVINHYTYAIVTDGDLMEGITSEAASLAGHLKLGKLIYCYDNNHITIDGSTDLTFTENVASRFEAYNWHVQQVENGLDVDAIDLAIQKAKQDPRPSLIIITTHIGYGSPKHQDKSSSHGSPLGGEDLANAKLQLDWPVEPNFYIPADVTEHLKQLAGNGAKEEEQWHACWEEYKREYPQPAAELVRRMKGELPANWDMGMETCLPKDKPMATRIASGKVLNTLCKSLPEIMGGSADLTSSNNVNLEGLGIFSASSPAGRQVHFGIREHAMGAIVNGIAYHGGAIPFDATYLVFTDYFRSTLRLAALSKLHTISIMTHDSFYVGQDGPTHQPIEQLTSLRLIPNLLVLRPADATETVEAWKTAILRKDGPTLLALTRQDVPQIDRTKYAAAIGLQYGAYVLADLGSQKPQMILMASGSEVSLIIKAGEQLAAEGISVRLVSFPSWELFKAQDKAYQSSVFPNEISKRISVEAGVSTGWEQWVGPNGKIIGLDHFGASASPSKLANQYGFTSDNVYREAKKLLEEKA